MSSVWLGCYKVPPHVEHRTSHKVNAKDRQNEGPLPRSRGVSSVSAWVWDQVTRAIVRKEKEQNTLNQKVYKGYIKNYI